MIALLVGTAAAFILCILSTPALIRVLPAASVVSEASASVPPTTPPKVVNPPLLTSSDRAEPDEFSVEENVTFAPLLSVVSAPSVPASV